MAGVERAWIPPAETQPSARLMLYNSMLDKKVPFVPRGGPDSKAVTWYCCGPTVYDVAHIGHARNYVTFDIIRRVLEDYLGYNVTYIMNVTDVDDKIILRARRNYLVDQYLREDHSPADLLTQCTAASEAAVGIQVWQHAPTSARTMQRGRQAAVPTLQGAVTHCLPLKYSSAPNHFPHASLLHRAHSAASLQQSARTQIQLERAPIVVALLMMAAA